MTTELLGWILVGTILPPFLVALVNAFTFRRIGADSRRTTGPVVSLLIPARNEERTIERVVTSLLAQEYPHIELIVLDDNSTDRTGEILSELSRGGSRLRVIDGRPLPPGWIGKNWACHQLAEAASGDILLFVDADTDHEPTAVAGIVDAFDQTGADLLSAVPRQITRSPVERLVVPMAPFLYFAFLPNRLIGGSRDRRFVAANGQVLGLRREAYDHIGGHESVAGDIIEDLRLAQRAKGLGARVELASAARVSRCRMYRNGDEVIEGFSKNLFPGLGFSVPTTLFFTLGMTILYVVPPLLLLLGTLLGWCTTSLLLLGTAGLVGMLTRLLSDIRFGIPPLASLLHPLSTVYVCRIALRSMALYRRGDGGSWKGRTYAANGGRKKSSRD